MTIPQMISATDARNNFFQIVSQVYFEKQPFIVNKAGVPMVQIGPIEENKKTTSVKDKKQEFSSFTSYFQNKYKGIKLSGLVVKERNRLYKNLSNQNEAIV